MKRLFSVMLILTIFSCRIKNNETRVSTKDSLLNLYLIARDSLPFADTLDSRNKILSAYHRSDTGYLRKLVEEIQDFLKYRNEIPVGLSCPKPAKINTYNFTEAYRFEYGAAFCDQAVSITVGERNDSIIMFGYHYKLVYNTDSCISFKEIDKTLSLKDWSKIRRGIYRADFWGLNFDNGRHGVDGSGLTVIGYEKSVNAFKGRYAEVSRWGAEETALGELFKDVLDISDVKAPCFHYY